MAKDFYIQRNAPDPILSESTVLELVRHHLPEAEALTGVDENGGEARTYAIDQDWILKTQRPQQLRPKTSLEKEVFILKCLENNPEVNVPKVLGYGKAEKDIEYTLMTRMPGKAIEFLEINGEPRKLALFELGRIVHKIHKLPQTPFLESLLFPGDHSPVDVSWRFGNLFDDVVGMIQQKPQLWDYPIDPITVSHMAMRALPDVDTWVVLHSNPGPEHAFALPKSLKFSGLIDFGDAYFSHPVHDLRRFRSPEDRKALFDGYVSEEPVNDNFLQTWKIAVILTDMIAMVRYLEYREAAKSELDQFLTDIK